MATLAPKELKNNAIHRPRPVPPPVTKAVFPLNDPGPNIGLFTDLKYFAWGAFSDSDPSAIFSIYILDF